MLKMIDKNNKEIDDFKDSLAEALVVFEENNKHARKRNRIAKRQLHQAQLNYEQVERQYLIEKSHLQPTFKLSVTEFLTCEPDFLNDPEQATEAKFLSGVGISIDERVLRINLEVKGDAVYMQPSIVIGKTQLSDDEQAFDMTDKLYFVAVDQVNVDQQAGTLDVYLVYRDKTTLPVIHKYKLVKRPDSTLLRWDAMHLDTVYVSSHKKVSRLKNAAGCADYFSDREQG